MIYLTTNWEMWGALGQWMGAIFTGVAVSVALWQVIEMKRQMNKSSQQEGIIRFKLNEDHLDIILNNVNVAPIFVNESTLFRVSQHPVRKQMNYQPIEDQRIQYEAPKLITHGDICVMSVPIELLVNEAEKEDQIFMSAYFFSSSGAFFRRSFYVEKSQKGQVEVYIAKEQKETLDIKEMNPWYGNRLISSKASEIER